MQVFSCLASYELLFGQFLLGSELFSFSFGLSLFSSMRSYRNLSQRRDWPANLSFITCILNFVRGNEYTAVIDI